MRVALATAKGLLLQAFFSVSSRFRLMFAGGLLILGYPPASEPLALLVALVPLLFEANDTSRSFRSRCLGVFVTLTSVGLLKFGWLSGSITYAIGSPPWVGMIVVVSYVLLVSTAYTVALVVPFAGQLPFRNLVAFLLLAGCTVAIPWPLPVSLAHGVVDLPGLAGLAAIGGVAAVDLAVLAINLLLTATLAASLGDGSARLMLAAVPTAGIVAFTLLPPTPPTPLPGPSLRVAILQPDLPIWRHLAAEPKVHLDMQNRVLEMAEGAMAQEPRPDLIVLPEYPSLFAYALKFEDHQRIERFTQSERTPMLLTAFRDVGHQGRTSTAILSEGTGSFQYSDKQMLFPFGEYLPGETLIPGLRRMFPDAGRLVSGKAPQALRIPGKDRPALGISLANTESFGDSRARDLHLLLARYRAIEVGIPILRVSNDGHSGLITPAGRMPHEVRLPPSSVMWRIIEVLPHKVANRNTAAVDGSLRLIVSWASMFILSFIGIKYLNQVWRRIT